MGENKETNKYLPYIKELFPDVGKDPKKDFEFCLKQIEKNFDRKQSLSLRALCFFTQEIDKEVAIEIGQVDRKSYKDIFISKKKAMKLLWELQNKFTNQEVFNRFNRDYLLRDMIIGAFRLVKFSKNNTFEDYKLYKLIAKDCCLQSGIAKNVVEIIPDYLHLQADRLNNLPGGISDQTAKDFIERHHGSWTRTILRKKFNRFTLKTRNFLSNRKEIKHPSSKI